MKPITYTLAFITYTTANIYIIAQIYASEEPIAMQAAFSILTFMILSITYLSLVDWLNEIHYPEPEQKLRSKSVGSDRRADRSIKKEETSHVVDHIRTEQERLKRKYAIK